MNWLAQFNDWIGKLPTTPYRIWVGSNLAVGTFLLYAAVVLMGKDGTLNLVAFGMWLGFVASSEGFAYKQFRAKRETDIGYMNAKKAEPSPVTVEAPASVTTSGDVKVEPDPTNLVRVERPSAARAKDLLRRQDGE
jgi:hypothetical protein